MFRLHLARLVAPLRRVRPRVPFFRLAAHRIPTLWSLYRPLLAEAPTHPIRSRVRALFRQHRHLTSTERTRKLLLRGYKYLDVFQRANRGDPYLRAVLLRYSRLIRAKIEKEHWKTLALQDHAWRTRLANRPILTGAYLRPSLFNKPLPRLKPQPLAITRIIAHRRAAKDKRLLRLRALLADLDHIRHESVFEDAADPSLPRVYSGSAQAEWEQPIKQAIRSIQASFSLSKSRATLPYPPDLLAAIKQARREKIANKTRERDRERRGEILPSTIRRQNKGPPAHILARMSPQQKKMDKVVRNLSEVGHVAAVKRKLGFKLRDPDAWKRELGPLDPRERERVDRLVREVREENHRRVRAQVL